MEQPSSNTWFAVSIGLVGLIVGYGLSSAMGGPSILPAPAAPSEPPVAADPTPAVAADPADADDDAVKGDANAKVTLIEFTDYQCPFCERHYTQTLPSIMKDYVDTGKVKYVVRDFPLSFHGNAHKAAEAAECAGEQGKYWDMHDKLFDTQGTWSNLGDATSTFKQYAKDLGLKSSFDSCLDNGDMAGEVDADLAAGSASGINGTPGFWIVSDDGKSQSVSGAYPYETFKAAFDSML